MSTLNSSQFEPEPVAATSGSVSAKDSVNNRLRYRRVSIFVSRGHRRRRSISVLEKVERRRGARRWLRVQRSSTSYAACSDPRLHVGQGDVPTVDVLKITWPDGTETLVPSPQAGQYHVVAYGS